MPIILDGENAWEYYDRNGRPFLQALYKRIQQDAQVSAVTVSERSPGDSRAYRTHLPGFLDQR